MALDPHGAVARALKDGVLVRPPCCSECGKECKPVAHHDDYSRPLDVRWLCGSCHRAHHAEHGAAPGGTGSRLVTMRLGNDPETLALCAALEQKLGQTRTAIVRLAIRRLAELEKVETLRNKREDGER